MTSAMADQQRPAGSRAEAVVAFLRGSVFPAIRPLQPWSSAAEGPQHSPHWESKAQ